MAEIGITEMHGSGDVGSAMITRLHWRPATARAITATDVGTACFQMRSAWSQMAVHMPLSVTWACSTTGTVIDENSGVLQRYLTDPAPGTPIVGGGEANHPAGLGVRANLRTSTVGTRRLMRGTWYFIPLSADQFTGQGGVLANVLSQFDSVIGNWISGLAASGLEAVVYHRPAKGQTTGGKAAAITAHDIPSTPAGLRSRRS